MYGRVYYSSVVMLLFKPKHAKLSLLGRTQTGDWDFPHSLPGVSTQQMIDVTFLHCSVTPRTVLIVFASRKSLDIHIHDIQTYIWCSICGMQCSMVAAVLHAFWLHALSIRMSRQPRDALTPKNKQNHKCKLCIWC